MNDRGAIRRSTRTAPAARGRRGSIYALVLGLAMLVTAVGVGALAAARFTGRAAAASDDGNEAGMLAFSACEQAIAKLNDDAVAAPYTWRGNYTSGLVAATVSLGRGRYQWVLVDPADGNLANDYSQPITVYGIGKVGKATRVYSVVVNAGGLGIDVLRSAYHANVAINVGGLSIVMNGPASSAGTAQGSGTLNGSLDAPSAVQGLTVTGTFTVVSSPKVMPSTNVFTTYKSKAKALPSSAAAGGSFSPGSLTASSNPWGAADPDGLYYLPLPAVSSVTIFPMRLQGTLVIESNSSIGSQTLQLVNEQYWAPKRSDYPVLIVKGVSTVKFGGSPFKLVTGGNTYPSEMRGLIHLIGTSRVELNSTYYLYGGVVADGTLYTSGTNAVVCDPNLYASPPAGYQRGDVLTQAAGTWKWDKWP